MKSHLVAIESVYKRLPRSPASLMSAAERLECYAVLQRVQDLVKGKRKNAGAELVEMLHRGPDREAVMRALTTGATDSRYADGIGVVMSFAALCFQRRRPAVLRAVVEAGVPQWVRDIPRLDRDPTERPEFAQELRAIQFSILGFPLPQSYSTSEWLRLLTTHRHNADDVNDWQSSLFRIAAVPPSVKCSLEFLELAFEVDPDHPDIEYLASKHPETIAALREMLMRRRLAAATAPVAPSEAQTTTPRRAGL